MRKWLFMAGAGLALCAGPALCEPPAQITDEAQRIYEKVQGNVFQIQVIDLATGKKSTTGSGFLFSADGHIATNYHVVSDAVHKPERFRVEYVREDESVGAADVLDVDVIHDLAILKSKDPHPSSLELGSSTLAKGTKIFSLGNPYDLGMSIVEGTFNGLMEKSLYPKILFSGSINSGMSGGPALDHDRRVVGINVSTAGNEISFLVPVEYLKTLFEHVQASRSNPLSDRNKYIQEQLLQHQAQFTSDILAKPWETLPFAGAAVPGEISSVIKCWGTSDDEENKLYSHAFITCSAEDTIFVSSSMETGQINFRFSSVNGRGLNTVRFYNLYEFYFNQPIGFDNAEGKDDVTNFECHEDFVTMAGRTWKTALCLRQYKKYPKLYDAGLFMASLGEKDTGLVVQMQALGLSRENAMAFTKKFMGEIRWAK